MIKKNFVSEQLTPKMISFLFLLGAGFIGLMVGYSISPLPQPWVVGMLLFLASLFLFFVLGLRHLSGTNLTVNSGAQAHQSDRFRVEMYAHDLVTAYLAEGKHKKIYPLLADQAMNHLTRKMADYDARAQKELERNKKEGIGSDEHQAYNEAFRRTRDEYWALSDVLSGHDLRQKKSRWKDDLPEDLREEQAA